PFRRWCSLSQLDEVCDEADEGRVFKRWLEHLLEPSSQRWRFSFAASGEKYRARAGNRNVREAVVLGLVHGAEEHPVALGIGGRLPRKGWISLAKNGQPYAFHVCRYVVAL